MNRREGIFDAGLDTFELDLERLRRPRDIAVKKMMESLKKRGQLTPVIVTENGEHLRLVDGFKRYRAAMKLARLLCAHIKVAGATIRNLGLHTSESRIWSRLIHLSPKYALIEEDGAMRINHGLSQQDLADSVGLTRIVVNRQLKQWRDDGFIEDGRGYVIISDPEAFEAFVWRDKSAD